MALRSIASLSVSFGLVSIPVKLFSATEQKEAIHFNLLHRGCGSRLRQQYTCIKENVVVERSDMVKGFEFSKDQYVTFTPEELKELEEAATGTVDISEFIPADKIDPIYFAKAYFLSPDKGGARPYSLLVAAMLQTKQCALARWAARGKQYLVLIRPVGDAMVMQQLLYADEVRSLADLELAPTQVKDQELKLATQLIAQISAKTFNPKAYEDEVKGRIEAAVEEKIQGHEIAVSPSSGVDRSPGQVIDLMEALRNSIGKTPPARPTPAAKSAERKPPKRVSKEAAAASQPKLKVVRKSA